MGLGINDNYIPFAKDHLPVGDQYFFLAFYEDHDGVAGNVKITDPFADPGMTALKDQFF